MMIRIKFLVETNWLDEGVFLYCEEPILSAKAINAQGKIIFVPTLEAVHAHVKTQKGDPSLRMLQFIKSRKYYLDNYSRFNAIQIASLKVSYGVLAFYYRIKGF